MPDLDLLIPLQEQGALAPLFCVHAVSGSAYSYAGLAQRLAPDRPVFGIEAPGFDGDRDPLRSLPALSAEYAQLLQAFRPAGGYSLLGWSMGGVVAFDTARRLADAGTPVDRVVLVDVGLPWVAPLPPEKEIQRRFVSDLLGIAGAQPEGLAAVFAGHPDDIAPARMFAHVERSGILPEEFDADLLEDRYAVFRAHIEALFAFEVKDVYQGAVTHVMSAGSDPRYMRWDGVAADLTEHTIPGDHHSIWAGANLDTLAALVRETLASG